MRTTLALVALLSLSAAAHADPHTARDALQQLLKYNADFAHRHERRYFDRFRDQQHPRVTLLACADSRFQTNDVEGDADDDLFVIRNIGNQLDIAAGSVEYGVRHLHTPLLLIVGHVGCGAVKAAMGDYSEESPALRHELDGLHLSLFHARAAGSAADPWLAGVIANVHQQVADARHEFADEIKAGRLVVVGAVYDFRDDLGHGAGRLNVIDIDGETDAKKLSQHPLLRAH